MYCGVVDRPALIGSDSPARISASRMFKYCLHIRQLGGGSGWTVGPYLTKQSMVDLSSRMGHPRQHPHTPLTVEYISGAKFDLIRCSISCISFFSRMIVVCHLSELNQVLYLPQIVLLSRDRGQTIYKWTEKWKH